MSKVFGKKPVATDAKVLKQLKAINKVLKEIRDILDSMWQQRSP